MYNFGSRNNPVLDSSLILYLDSLNPKSVPLEPTVNLLYVGMTMSPNWTIQQLGGGTISRSVIIPNYKYRITSETLNSDAFRMNLPLDVLIINQPYRFSYKWTIVSGTGTFSMIDWNDTSVLHRENINYGTYSFSSLRGYNPPLGSYDSTYRFIDFNMSDNMVVDIWDIQLERKTYSTPFVAGSRGWNDLSGNGNHMSLTGSLVYDPINGFSGWGTMSKFYKDNFPSNLKTSQSGNGYTTLVWAKMSTASSWSKIIGNSDASNYIDLYAQSGTGNYYQEDGSKLFYNDAIGVDKGVFNITDGVWRMYGSTNSNGGSSVNPTSSFQIGNSETWSTVGNISVIYLYNRILDIDEIKSIFNHQRERFGY